MFAYAILITYRVATRRFSVPLTALTLQFRLLRCAISSLAVKPPLSLIVSRLLRIDSQLACYNMPNATMTCICRDDLSFSLYPPIDTIISTLRQSSCAISCLFPHDCCRSHADSRTVPVDVMQCVISEVCSSLSVLT